MDTAMMIALLVAILIFVVALLYSTVGHAGASGYLAAMALVGMTPLVMKRIGDESTEAFKRWAWGPSLRIMYVNTFARVGVADAPTS